MDNNLLYTVYINFFNIQLEYYNIQNNIEFDNKLKKKEIYLIGIFDKSLKIWHNAWALNNYSGDGDIDMSRKFLIYFINREKSNFDTSFKNNIINNIIKSIVCNSKIYITEYKTQLQLILAIFLFFTKKNMYNITKINNLFYFFAYDKNTTLLK